MPRREHPCVSCFLKRTPLFRETSRRVLGMAQFTGAIMGGIVLYKGQIAEMQTGEGKTLTAALPTFLHALSERVAYFSNSPNSRHSTHGGGQRARERGRVRRDIVFMHHNRARPRQQKLRDCRGQAGPACRGRRQPPPATRSNALEAHQTEARAQVDLFAAPPEAAAAEQSAVEKALGTHRPPDALSPREALDALYRLTA